MADPQLRRYPWAAAGALTCYLVFMATDNGLDYVNQVGIYVFAMIALGEKAVEFTAAARPSVQSVSPRPPLPNLLRPPPVRLL